MWDFSFAKAIQMVVQTMPLVLLRLAVYIGIGLAYVFSIGTGAAFGWAFGGAPLGALIGFGLTSAILYWGREYLLYLVKAAHIAVLVELLDGRSVPAGQSQIAYGKRFVETHFLEASVLFGVDQVVKAVLRILFRSMNWFALFMPIPGFRALVRLAEAAIRVSLTYVDEIILAYLIRTRTRNPWATAGDGIVLYAQNYKHLLKNAAWLAAFLWLAALAIFIVVTGPFIALAAVMQGGAAIWGIVLAAIFALALKSAVLEPVAIAALMQVYFRTIEGQTPDAAWRARLDSVSGPFRDLSGKAAGWVPGPKFPDLPAAGAPA